MNNLHWKGAVQVAEFWDRILFLINIYFSLNKAESEDPSSVYMVTW